MDVSEVIAIYRQRADDGVHPYHTSDETLIGFTAEAEEEACIRARLLFDDSGTLCTLTLVPGVSRYTIDPSIFEIEKLDYVNLDNARFKTERAGAEELLAADQSVQGRPFRFAHIAADAIGIWPIPNTYSTGTLQLAVYRTPLFPVEELDDPFEIHEHWHRHLVDWLLYRAYSTKDSEMRDDARAAEAYQRFEQRFGIRRPADILRRHREKRSSTITYSGL